MFFSGGNTRMNVFSNSSTPHLSKLLLPLAAPVPFAAAAIQQKVADSELEAEAPPSPRHKPPSIEAICSETKYTRKEIQIMYRAFKQCCPNGTLMLEHFKEIYAQFFPRGNVEKYAEFVFRTFDRDGDSMLNFEDFVLGLSVISRGSMLEKLDWIFTLYDIEKRGVIGYPELSQIAQSIYDLLGESIEPPVTKTGIYNHVTAMIKRLDTNNDGLITRAEFIEMCQKDRRLCESLESFDTRL